MTAIRLLNNELQAVLKADDVKLKADDVKLKADDVKLKADDVKLKADDVSCSRLSVRPDKKEWQAVGANKEKEKSKTRKRNPEKNEKEPQSWKQCTEKKTCNRNSRRFNHPKYPRLEPF